jgi:hypothetical protein
MSEPAKIIPISQDFVSVALKTFPGAKIVYRDKPLICTVCNKDNIPKWRRGGKIVALTQPDGLTIWACHYCGRRC